MTAACPELVFDVTLHPTAALGDAARRALWTAVVAALEARGLSAALHSADAALRFRVTRDAGQAIDADREAVRAWAESRPDVERVVVGPLLDLRATPG